MPTICFIVMLSPYNIAPTNIKTIAKDIIAIGSDQNHDIAKLQEQLDKRGIKAVAKRVKDYRKGELDSTCKIINRIKHSELEEKNLDCSNVINDD